MAKEEPTTPEQRSFELKPDDIGFAYVLRWMDYLLKHEHDADQSYIVEWRQFVLDCQSALSTHSEKEPSDKRSGARLNDLIERLREHSEAFAEPRVMEMWDAWRRMIAGGSRASMPRDGFESLIDGVAQDTAEAADRLEVAQSLLDRARQRGELSGEEVSSFAPSAGVACSHTLADRLRLMYLCAENVNDGETLKEAYEAIERLSAPSAKEQRERRLLERARVWWKTWKVEFESDPSWVALTDEIDDVLRPPDSSATK